MTYWDNFAAKLNAAGYRLSERHIAVSAAFFSVNVNCSSQASVFLEHLSPEMTDAEMICEIYKIRNTILAEQNVILTCMSAFSHIILMVNFATGMPLKFRENRLYNRDVWCYTIKDVLCAD